MKPGGADRRGCRRRGITKSNTRRGGGVAALKTAGATIHHPAMGKPRGVRRRGQVGLLESTESPSKAGGPLSGHSMTLSVSAPARRRDVFLQLRRRCFGRIVLINRVKPHTFYLQRERRGVMKMISLASATHAARPPARGRRAPRSERGDSRHRPCHLRRAHPVGGVAIVKPVPRQRPNRGP